MENLKKDIYNLDRLINVKIFDRELSGLIYKPYRKRSFWYSEIKEGFYTYMVYYSIGDIKKNPKYTLEEGNILYLKSCVDLYFSDKITKTIYFDTIEDANEWYYNNIVRVYRDKFKELI